jgi:hypothetical protein
LDKADPQGTRTRVERYAAREKAVNVRVGYDLNLGHLTVVHRVELVAAQPFPREARCEDRTAK